MSIFKIKNILGEQQTDAFHNPKGFDFEYQDDSDVSGPNTEIAIDDLISQFEDLLQKEFSADVKTRNQGRLAIKKLWIEKIKQWDDANKGAGIPGGE